MENKTQDYQSEILAIIRGNTSPGVMRNKLEDYHENDLADVFSELTAAERRKVCRILNLDMLSDIFEYIDEKQAAEYLDEMDVRKAAGILSGMETDAVVDVLRMTPKEKKVLLIELMDDEARKDMAIIASFDEEEIGSKMTTNCIMIRENLTVKQAMSSLIGQAAKNDNISTLFMVTEDNTFYGAMDLKDLIIARRESPLEDLIATSYPYVYGNELIDDCIEKLKDYSENSIPVLDNDNKDFSLTFNNLSYSDEQQKYNYRLLPYQGNWLISDEGEKASYTNLPAGEYVFEVKNIHPNGQTGAVTSLKIVILPHWSQTFAFRLFVSLLLLGGD